MRNCKLFLTVAIVYFGAINVNADYKPEKFLFLRYGESDSELFITPPVYDAQSPQDSVILSPAIGPDLAVVDMQDNVIFGSTADATIQGFDKNGKQILALFYAAILDSSTDSVSAVDEFPDEPLSSIEPNKIGSPYQIPGLANISIDTKSRLYIEAASDQNYIAIVNLDGIMTGRIYPPDFGLDINLQDMIMSSENVLSFLDNRLYDTYTYRKGKLYLGGLMGWLAHDNFYYSAEINKDKKTIDFSILGDPKTPAVADAFRMQSIPIPDNLDYCGVMGVSDDMRIFVTGNSLDEKLGQMILVFNTKLEMIVQFRMKKEIRNKLQLSAPLPYFRPDGVIFEFRCEDDGMRIIRWSDDGR